jgi:CRP/FNR family transcriptional regulator, cyclic AMP receptor protein
MIENLERIIAEHSFFRGMEERHIRFIAGCAKNVRFAEEQFMFREGDPAVDFYFIREGMVAIELMVPHRGRTIVQTVAAGEIVGWSWLVAPYRWHFDGRALLPTRALAFDGKCLLAKCEEDHDLGYEILKRFAHVVSERLEVTRLQLLDLYGTVV